MENNYDCLKIGTKVFYTGDLSNAPGTGEITDVLKTDLYPVLYDIELNEQGGEKRIFKNLTPSVFKDSPKRRFILKTEYEDEQRERIEELQNRVNSQ